MGNGEWGRGKTKAYKLVQRPKTVGTHGVRPIYSNRAPDL
jgi:hypothetical protein